MKKHISYLLVIVLLVSVNTYSQDRDKNTLIQNFRDKYHGELFIKWNKVNAGPSKIMGNNIYLHSNSVDKSTIPTLTRDFIKENEDLLCPRNTQLNLESITKLKNKFIVAYQQLYKGIPLWNIKLMLKLAKNGYVLMIKSPCFDDPKVSIQPKITLEQAKRNVAANFNIDIKKIQDGELIIYPESETGDLYLCWPLFRSEYITNNYVYLDNYA